MRFDPKTGRELKKLRECLGIPKNEKVCFEAGDTRQSYPPARVLADIKPTFAVMPTQSSVLYCLLSDMDCGDQPFHDFCGDLGYDEDSREAERIYFACQESGRKLRKVFKNVHIEAIRTHLEDY